MGLTQQPLIGAPAPFQMMGQPAQPDLLQMNQIPQPVNPVNVPMSLPTGGLPDMSMSQQPLVQQPLTQQYALPTSQQIEVQQPIQQAAVQYALPTVQQIGVPGTISTHTGIPMMGNGQPGPIGIMQMGQPAPIMAQAPLVDLNQAPPPIMMNVQPQMNSQPLVFDTQSVNAQPIGVPVTANMLVNSLPGPVPTTVPATIQSIGQVTAPMVIGQIAVVPINTFDVGTPAATETEKVKEATMMEKFAQMQGQGVLVNIDLSGSPVYIPGKGYIMVNIKL